MGLTAIEGYDKLPTLYTSYVASSITDMQGNAYTPSQVWTDYSSSKLVDPNGTNVAGQNIYLRGNSFYTRGSEVQAAVTNSGDSYLYTAGGKVTAIGSSVSAIETTRSKLYAAGSQVRVLGTSHSPTQYTLSGGTKIYAVKVSSRYTTLYEAGNYVTPIGDGYTPSTFYKKVSSYTVVGESCPVGKYYTSNGASVYAIGSKVTYTASSANPRFYNASSAAQVTLNKATLTTSTANVLKV